MRVYGYTIQVLSSSTSAFAGRSFRACGTPRDQIARGHEERPVDKLACMQNALLMLQVSGGEVARWIDKESSCGRTSL